MCWKNSLKDYLNDLAEILVEVWNGDRLCPKTALWENQSSDSISKTRNITSQFIVIKQPWVDLKIFFIVKIANLKWVPPQ